MADTEDDVMDGEGAAPQKGGKGLLIPGLLKWVAIGIGGLILVVTIVVITFHIMGGSQTGTSNVPMQEEYVQSREVLDWYTSLGSIRTKTNDPTPASVVVDVVFGYKKEDKATSTEITQRTVELKDFLRRFFTQKAKSELKADNEENLKIEIRNAINDSILSTSKIKDVRFMQLDVIEQ